jgi:hypothetical protein
MSGIVTVGLTTLPPSMSRLSRQCGILNISQLYRPPRPVMGMFYFYYLLRYFCDVKTLQIGGNRGW